MSRDPWNTGTGEAGEDMPRKSLDIRLTDYPIPWSASVLADLPPARTGAGRARETGQGTCPLRVLRAAP